MNGTLTLTNKHRSKGRDYSCYSYTINGHEFQIINELDASGHMAWLVSPDIPDGHCGWSTLKGAVAAIDQTMTQVAA